MLLSLESPKYTDTFVKIIQDDNEIVECHYLAGDYDYALKITSSFCYTFDVVAETGSLCFLAAIKHATVDVFFHNPH